MTIKKERIEMERGGSGFTLIEILIVVAIIAILASIVIVGLGPAQQSGRDARRISDLQSIQNGLELYYQKCGYYPGAAVPTGSQCTGWTSVDFSGLGDGANGALTGSDLGISSVPNDPTGGKTYYYTSQNGTSYVLGAVLENLNNSVFQNYQPPAYSPTGITCGSAGAYCVSL